MAPVLEEFASQNHDVLVAKINATSEKKLCKSMGVKLFPTLIAFSHGDEIDRHVGPLSIDELALFLDQRSTSESETDSR